jgi:hypothetical protein
VCVDEVVKVITLEVIESEVKVVAREDGVTLTSEPVLFIVKLVELGVEITTF